MPPSRAQKKTAAQPLEETPDLRPRRFGCESCDAGLCRSLLLPMQDSREGGHYFTLGSDKRQGPGDSHRIIMRLNAIKKQRNFRLALPKRQGRLGDRL